MTEFDVASVRRRLRPLRPDPRRWYGATDPRSWAVLAKHTRMSQNRRHDLRRAVDAVRSVQRSGNFLATLPRSGSNWLILQLSIAKDLSRGGSGDFSYISDATPAGGGKWEPLTVVGWDATPALLALQLRRCPTAEVLEGALMTSHFPADSPIVRPLDLPSVVLIRNPVAQLDSVFRMIGEWPVMNRPGYFERLTDSTIRFFNTWGAAIERNGDTHHPVIRYETLAEDTASIMARLSDRFGLGLTSASIEVAVEATSRDRLLERQTADRDWRVSRPDDTSMIPDEWWDRCVRRLEAGLTHRFGYELVR